MLNTALEYNNYICSSHIKAHESSQRLDASLHACCLLRAILLAEKCLLFEPNTVSSRKFLQIVAPRLAASEDMRRRRAMQSKSPMSSEVQGFNLEDPLEPPFELECLEGAFMVATGATQPHLASYY